MDILKFKFVIVRFDIRLAKLIILKCIAVILLTACNGPIPEILLSEAIPGEATFLITEILFLLS